MKKRRSPSRSSSYSSASTSAERQQHRRTMLGLALVLLGVLVVLNLIATSGAYRAQPVEGAGMYQTR